MLNKKNLTKVLPVIVIVHFFVYSIGSMFGIYNVAADEYSGYTLTFEEDFNGSTLDIDKWNNFHKNSNPLGTAAIIGDDAFAYHPDNVSVPGDGYCHISATKEAVTVGEKTVQYRTGMIQTRGKFYQIGGRFEARIKIPGTDGTIPAFWMMPNNSDTDFIGLGGKGSEIDIMEHTMHMTNYITNNVHWGGYGASHQQWGGKPAYTEILTDWHTYALEWEPPDHETGFNGEYRFYIDGNLKNTYTGEAVSYGNQMIILSMALGDWGGTVDDTGLPCEMLIDWCRVYQKNERLTSFPEGGYSFDFNNLSGWTKTGDFGNETYKGWTFGTTTGNNKIQLLDQGDGDNCLNFITYPKTHTQWPYAYFDFHSTEKRFAEAEFKTYFEIGDGLGYTISARFNDAPEGWVDIMSIASNGVYDKITSGSPQIISSLAQGTYHKFNIRFDRGAGASNDWKIHIYKDDNFIYTINADNFPSYRRGLISLRFNMVSDAYNANFRIDDIYINESNDNTLLRFEDKNGISLKNIKSGKITAKVSITNPSETEEMPVIIAVASYKEDSICDIKFETRAILAKKRLLITPEIICDVTEEMIKVIIWDNTDKMSPYRKAQILHGANAE